MLRLQKMVLFILTFLVLIALSACTLGQADQPTLTPVDIDAVKTAAAAAAAVELTRIAAAIPPTSTATIPATDTPTQSPTDTLVPGAPTLTLTQTATQLIIAGTTITPIPSFTPLPSGGGSSSGQLCKNSQFGGDINIPDGTVFKPWQKFSKAWNVKNTGTCRWDEGFYFAGVEGPPSMAANQEPYYFRSPKDFVGPGESVNIYISMYAPGDPGDYVAHWHMFDDNGQPFGGDFTVVIKVVK